MAYFNKERAAVIVDIFLIPGLGSLLLGGEKLKNRGKKLLLWWAITLGVAVVGFVMLFVLAFLAPKAAMISPFLIGGGLLANIGVRLWAIVSGIPILIRSIKDDREVMQKLPASEKRKTYLTSAALLAVVEVILLGLYFNGMFDSAVGLQYLLVKYLTLLGIPILILVMLFEVWRSSRIIPKKP